MSPSDQQKDMMLSQIESLIGLDEVAQFSLTVHAFHLEFSLTSWAFAVGLLYFYTMHVLNNDRLPYNIQATCITCSKIFTLLLASSILLCNCKFCCTQYTFSACCVLFFYVLKI